jgi:hypothetical protein
MNSFIYFRVTPSEDSSNCGSKGILLVLKPLTDKQRQQNSNVQQVKNHVHGLVSGLSVEYHPKFNISMLNNAVP